MADGPTTITVWSVVSLLAGTVISAIVSYVLQRRSFAEARAQKAQDKFDTRKALGLNLFHKMMRIASTLELLKDSLANAFARAQADKVEGEPWQIVKPLANLPGRVSFSAEEKTFLMLLDMNLFNDIGPFDDLHNSILDMFELYRTQRIALSDTLPATMRGTLGITNLSDAEKARIAPRAAALNMLVEGMIRQVSQDSSEAWTLLQSLQQALNKEFKMALRMERTSLPA